MYVRCPQVLCTIPNELLRWVTVGVACGISGGALFGNLGPIVVSSVPARGTIICLVLGALHVGVALAFKVKDQVFSVPCHTI